MLDLKVRKLAFDFKQDAPFQWLPENPRLALTLNATSFFAVGFERYVVKTMREAMPLIKNPDILGEAKSFQGQEAQHGLAHKSHIDAMIRQYPKLKDTYDKVCRHFDELHDNKTVEFRLAYVANLESAFPPVMTFTIENREKLFSGGNRKIASLFLWHAIEETEHRGSASTIYDHLVGKRWYRLAKLPAALKHLAEFDTLIRKEFETNIALDERMAGMAAPPSPFARIPTTQRIVLALRLMRSFWPWYNAENERLPQWFNEWMQADNEGIDMTTFYGR